jgi:hypothetical protein
MVWWGDYGYVGVWVIVAMVTLKFFGLAADWRTVRNDELVNSPEERGATWPAERC